MSLLRWRVKAALAVAVVIAALALAPSIALAGTLQGHVYDKGTGFPLMNALIDVQLVNADGSWTAEGIGVSDPYGGFLMDGLPAGNYLLYTYDLAGQYQPQYYDNQPQWPTANLVPLPAIGTVTLNNINLERYTQISGNVTRKLTGAPLANIQVFAAQEVSPGNWTNVGGAFTDASGNYTVTNIVPGDYHVLFSDAAATPVYPDVSYPDIYSMPSTGNFSLGATVTAPADGTYVTGIDQAMAKLGSITTHAQKYSDATPVAGSTALIAKPSGSPAWEGTQTTGVVGDTFQTLPGDYKVAFYGLPTGYLNSYWQNVTRFSDGTTLTVTDGDTYDITQRVFRASTVGGHVTKLDTGGNVANAGVAIESLEASGWAAYGSTTANASGVWTASVAPGTYRFLFTDPAGNYAAEYYGVVRPVPDPVTVGIEATVNTINEALYPLDHTPPHTTANYLHGWINHDVSVSLTATDGTWGSGVASSWYSTSSPNATATYTSPFLVTAEGTTTLGFGSVDTSGNVEATQSATVLVDKTNPTPSQGVVLVPGRGTLTLSATDALSGVAGVVYRADGASSDTTYTAPLVYDVGPHSVTYRALDVAGNWSATQTAVFTVQPIMVSGKATDIRDSTAVSGAHITAELWNGTNWVAATSTDTAADGTWSVGVSAGRYRFYYEVLPASGLESRYYGVGGAAVTPVDVAIDTTVTGIDQALAPPDLNPPVTTATVSPDIARTGWSNATTVAVSLTASDGAWGTGVAFTWYRVGAGGPRIIYASPAQVTAEGTTTVYFGSVDGTGNVEASKSVDVHIDRTGPVVTQVVTPASGSTVIALSATDALSGVASIRYSVDGAPEVTYSAPITFGPGSHTLSYRGLDVAGNYGATTNFGLGVAGPVSLGKPYLSPQTPKPKKSFNVKGGISTAAYGPTTITLLFDKKSGSKWKSYAKSNVSIGAGVTSYVKGCKFSGKGSYRVRAYQPADATHFSAYSAYRTFSVK